MKSAALIYALSSEDLRAALNRAHATRASRRKRRRPRAEERRS